MKRAFQCILLVQLLGFGFHTADAAPRTFVSGGGSDSAPCARLAPCLTFAFAFSQTDANGEINCIDPGDFGTDTITRSVTIDCGGTFGGINVPAAGLLATGTTGIIVNGAGVVVRLRNLSLDGNGAASVGINFMNGTALFVENCVVANFTTGVFAGHGVGIKFAPPAGVTGELYVKDSVISGNGRPADGGGIIVQPQGSGAARVVIERTRVLNNTYGIFANGSGSTGVISIQIRDSVSAQNKNHGVSAFTAAGAAVTSITMERSSSLLNGGDGILSQGSPAFVLLGGSTVMSNGTGLAAVSGGSIFSYQDNQLSGNVADGAPTGTLPVH